MSTDAIVTTGAGIRYVKESTYGTDPDSWTTTLDPLSYGGLIAKADKASSRGMNMGGARVRSRSILGRKNVPFSASHYLTYAGMGLLFSLGLGEPATTGPVGSKYTHTWELDSHPASATVAIVEGEALGSLTTQRREGHGVVITEFGIEGKSHDTVVVSLSGMGQAADAPASASAVTITNASDAYVEGFHSSNLSWNSRSDPFQSVRLTLPNAVNFRDRMQEQTTARPYGASLKDIRVVITMEKITTAYQVAQPAKTASDLVLTWTNPDNSDETFVITLENAEVEDCVSDASGPGILTETITFKPSESSSKTGLKIVLTNEDSSAEAA